MKAKAVVPPEIFDLLEQVRTQALSYDEAEEYFPWRTRAFYRQLNGCNFLMANEKPEYLDLVLRLPSRQHQEAIKMPYVTSAYGDSKTWLNIKVSTQAELDTVKPWIELSYRISDPFRSKAELIDGENPLVLNFLDQLREDARQYGEIEEFFPYGSRAFRHPPKGQIFLYASELPDALLVSVRLPYGEREFALEQPFVEVPKYLGHKGWVSATVTTQDELDLVLTWVESSHEMNQPVRKSKMKKLVG